MTKLVQVLALMLWPQVAMAASPRASSTLRDSEGTQHSANKAFDGLPQTGWAEGEDGLETGPGSSSHLTGLSRFRVYRFGPVIYRVEHVL